MPDTVTPERRSELMSNIRAKGTKPDLAGRRITHAMGYRYRLLIPAGVIDPPVNKALLQIRNMSRRRDCV